jgi:hypothetical protein
MTGATSKLYVRSRPFCGLKRGISRNPRGAKNGREQLQQDSAYSMTSSARASSVGGTSKAERLGGFEIDHHYRRI